MLVLCKNAEQVFQHAAARRRLALLPASRFVQRRFNTQPPEGGWGNRPSGRREPIGFNTQPPEGGWELGCTDAHICMVSTRSRPKAAGLYCLRLRRLVQSFNTQPPEGGWVVPVIATKARLCFNTQPPEGGWFLCASFSTPSILFQHAAARRRLETWRR